MKTEWKDVAHLYLGCEGEAMGIAPFKTRLVACNTSVDLRDGITINAIEQYSFKPFLRPLSDLTREVDGIIPIVELRDFEATNYLVYIDKLKMLEQLKTIEIKTFEYPEGNEHTIRYIEPYGNMTDGIIDFSYSERFHRFSKVMLQPMRKPLSVGGQLPMFQKLFEWRFDLFNLIESGQAINKALIPQPTLNT